uniref:DUF4939 domain-containing protein n=1 Tax=Cyprinodon variegatus TaxID=28743 RepID=A0A3Q2DRC9_CYPVA
MDPAEQLPAPTSEVQSLRDLISRHGGALGQSEHGLTGLETASQTIHMELAQLTAQVAHLTSLLTSVAAPQPPLVPQAPASEVPQPQPASPSDFSQAAAPSVNHSGAYVPDPPPFSGELSKCRGFLLQCQMVFSQQPSAFASDLSRIYYVMGLLQEQALAWARPWSHISLDFVTGLPLSQGKAVILTIVDRFSKAAHFVPLPKLPTAAETADLLVSSCGPAPWHPSRHSFGPWPTVHLQGVESLLPGSRSHS